MSLAFFDIDGTLLAKPSLECRFFRDFCRQRKIPAANYLRWVAETLRLGLHDFRAAAKANKMYLRGVRAEVLSAPGAIGRAAWLPEFFPAALERICWHSLRADAIVLVSGTLSPLAEIVKYALQRELLWRGVAAKIFVIATQLEVCDGRWTGRVSGAAMFGEAKAHAIKQFADAQQIPLLECSAYGDSSLDRWMLASVGHPFAVNAIARARRLARRHGWRMLAWTHCPVRSAGAQRETQNTGKRTLKWTL
jgi:HAD superfamily hydrolase (TIGR01490 family)